VLFMCKNERYLIETFARCIDQAEQTADRVYVSCREMLVNEFQSEMKKHRSEVRGFGSDTDYYEIAWSWIVNMAFDHLSSGEFHFYAGQLKPQGRMMLIIYQYGMNWAFERGHISQEEYDEQLTLLRETISSLG